MFFELIGVKVFEKYYNTLEEGFKSKKKNSTENKSTMDRFIDFIRLVILCIALYVCFKRNKGLSIYLFVACCYPTYYLIYALATGGTLPDADIDED